MEIKEIKNKEAWEDFLFRCKDKTFLNSWNWGEFQKKEGFSCWRLGVYDKEELIGVSLVIKIKAKRGTFLFLPHGPNVKYNDKNKEVLESLLGNLKKLALKEKASFIRISPILERKEENKGIFKDLGFKKAPLHIHPEITWVLDIRPEEKNLLMNMRKNTRYEIRKGMRTEGLEIIKSDKKEDVEVFNELYKKTASRHDFVPFSESYLKNQYESFSSDDGILTFHAKHKGEILSSAIAVFWQKMAFYHHGASVLKHKKIPSSPLLQWEMIKEAKKRGCEKYNFWGIADIPKEEVKKRNHPWAGLTIFKEGFGGYDKKYVKTQDFLISQKYWLNYFIEKVRRIKRNY